MDDDISLLIRGEEFIVNKELLCEYSDYFRAMFSGNYIENDQRQIVIDVLSPSIMRIILQYMNIGLIDLTEHTHPIVSELAMAANFLQLSELIKQIEYTLDLQLSVYNWMDTLIIAENASYVKLEQFSAAFGLFSFKSMKTCFIKSIKKLFWYLSHPYLDTGCEIDVFKFGLEWVLNNETGADALMVVLGCLDLTRLSAADFVEMKSSMVDYMNSLPLKVVACLHDLLVSGHVLSEQVLLEQRDQLCEKFSKRIYNECYSLVKESKTRKLYFTSSVPMTIKEPLADESPHYMYTYRPNVGFEKWLELVEKNLWGWNVTSYNGTKLIVVCGEYGKGTGVFMRDVKVYDTLRKEWNRHGVQLPYRRHGSVVVVGDSLYIIGGVGGFRVVLDTAIIYNLREKTFRNIAKLPDAIQDPAICSHESEVYTAGHKHIYKYEDTGDTDRWNAVARVEMRIKCMVSYKGYIYCTQNYFCELYKFKPNEHGQLQFVTCFINLPTVMCNLDGRLLAFTQNNKLFKQTDILSVEEHIDTEQLPKVLFLQTEGPMRVNETAGCCTLVTNAPPLEKSIADYHMRYLLCYPEMM
ncbi:kelch-like protein 8 [Battus philenor]|uniref:kelch-like protein 8 n=1 Tax=Battus philenor TaxID=42288 RepID=UPI0035CF74BE